MDHYLTIETTGLAEYVDRGSKFIAIAFPVKTAGDFKLRLAEIKKEHPKAVHHCFAYRIGISGNDYRVSDDGEPSGTAGRQILGQIDSRGLVYTAIVVVRYFGGVLLGVPGLIKAYKTSAALVLQTIPAVKKNIEQYYIIQFGYQHTSYVLRIVKYLNATILEQEIGLFPFIKIGITSERENEFFSKMGISNDINVKKIVTL